MLDTFRSIPDLRQLADWLQEQFGLTASVSCELIRWNWNDTYLVTTASHRFICRVYGADRHDDAAIDYELEFIRHLKGAGIRACAPVATIDGRRRVALPVAEGPRAAVLFEFAPGRIDVPSKPEKARLFGSALARLHIAAEDFASPGGRDTESLTDRLETTLKHLPSLLSGRDDESKTN